MKLTRALTLSATTMSLLCGFMNQSVNAATSEEISKVSQYHGGMIVVNGSDDISLLESLSKTGFTVQVLAKDESKVQSLRTALEAKKLGGTISVKHFDGKNLPYIVNL